MSAQSTVRPRVVADIAMFYGERSGGIRTYLDEKSAFAERTGAFEHHVIVPAARERHGPGRHELRGLKLTPSTGYRLPLGAGSLKTTVRRINPDVVLVHDPFWAVQRATAEAHRLGAKVVAVHHASAALNAAGIPGPDSVYEAVMRRIYHHAYENVDAVMSVVDPLADSGRRASIPLRFGVHHAFRPGPGVRRRHVLYVGRLSLEKGIEDLLVAASISPDPWPLWLVGDGPARAVIAAKAEKLGIAGRLSLMPFTADRQALARLYREAACVVQPGPHETFGLVALEAAASGARVVTCASTPSARVAPAMIETYDAGDAGDLLDAIDRSLRTDPDAAAAAALGEQLRWDAAFSAEIADLERLAGQARDRERSRAA